MSGAGVLLCGGLVGDVPGERTVVYIVSVRRRDGSDDPNQQYSFHDDEDEAEDRAAALANRLSLPIIDERDLPDPEPVPFRRPRDR